MRVNYRYALYAVVLSGICASSPARAQDEQTAGDVAAARALGVDGVRAADAGDCNDAIEKLTRAEKLHHAVSTLARLGECQVQVGKLVDGTENLQRAIREPLPPNAPAVFAAAQERAKKVLADAKPRIARLKIAVAAPPDAQLTVKVDGENVPPANLNTNRMVDPGEHVVEASAPGFLKASAKVKLGDGGSDSVALTLEADPNAPKPEPARPGAPGDAQSAAPRGKDRTAVYIAGGVGLLGVALGTGFGFAAVGAKSDLDKTCGTDKVCPPASSDKLDSAKMMGTLSTISFIVGGVGLAAALTFYAIDFGAGGTPAPATGGNARALRVGAYVGPGAAGLRGSF